MHSKNYSSEGRAPSNGHAHSNATEYRVKLMQAILGRKQHTLFDYSAQ